MKLIAQIGAFSMMPNLFLLNRYLIISFQNWPFCKTNILQRWFFSSNGTFLVRYNSDNHNKSIFINVTLKGCSECYFLKMLFSDCIKLNYELDEIKSIMIKLKQNESFQRMGCLNYRSINNTRRSWFNLYCCCTSFRISKVFQLEKGRV